VGKVADSIILLHNVHQDQLSHATVVLQHPAYSLKLLPHDFYILGVFEKARKFSSENDILGGL
jgi:hypothetical protein